MITMKLTMKAHTLKDKLARANGLLILINLKIGMENRRLRSSGALENVGGSCAIRQSLKANF